MLLLLLLQLWCGKGFTAMTAHTLLITSCLAGLSLLAQSLPGIYLCLEKRTGPFIFSSFSSSCGTGVASSCPCWSPRALTSGSLLGASSEVIGHPTPLASTSHPSAWLHGFRQLLPLCSAAAHRLFFCHLGTLSLFAGGGWL